jgi:predicted nuclease of restriction endonuclease-like (RecB) superfamily
MGGEWMLDKEQSRNLVESGERLANKAALLADLRQLIKETRTGLAAAVNAALTILYWRVGNRIRRDVLAEKRADYGQEIVVTLSRQLVQEYGNGFAEKNLRRMMQFAEIFPDEQIVVTLSRQLSWSHFLALIPLDKPFQRDFYAEMCRIEGWSVRTLRQKIDAMLYERTALSRKPDDVIRHELKELQDADKLSPNLVFRDPYFLDFLGLTDRYLEKDLEDAILRELENFLLELGNGFAFLARQKRIQLDNDDYYIDLLFYHRRLNRLIAIELKLGDFKAEYKGQMELYLRWLSKYEKQPGENEPLGLILCAGKKQELVELLELNQSGIHVADYLTELPPRKVLEEKLYQAIENARERLGNRGGEDA